MDDSQLRSLIQSEIRAGYLPSSSESDRLFGGKGDGGRCMCCGNTIIAGAVQSEVVDGAGTALLMHLHCYDEWRKVSEVLMRQMCAEI